MTGRGKVRVRGKIEIEELKNGKIKYYNKRNTISIK